MSRDFVWSSFIIWHICLLECSESWNNKHFLQNNTCNKISNTRTGKAASTKKYCPQNMVESLKRVRRLVNNLYKPTDSKWLILVTKKTTNTKEEEQRFLSSMVFSVYEVFRITYITNQLCNWKVMQTTLLTLTDMQERTLCLQGTWTPNVFLECYCFKDL